MSGLFPYIVEYEAANPGPVHNSCSDLSREGAADLYSLLIENPRVTYARYWRVGVEGNCAEFWR